MAYQYEYNNNNGTIITTSNNVNLDKRVTSEQNLYQIIDIAYVVNSDRKGRLSLSICPGKKDSRWNRDLQSDLERIKLNGIQVIICLLEWAELRQLNITDYPGKAQEAGFVFYHLPIKDRGVTNQKELTTLIPIIVNHLGEGHNVLVHCRGGLGRAGTICSCCLCHFGYDDKLAIETVRKKRPGAVQTTQQENCVTQYHIKLINNF